MKLKYVGLAVVLVIAGAFVAVWTALSAPRIGGAHVGT